MYRVSLPLYFYYKIFPFYFLQCTATKYSQKLKNNTHPQHLHLFEEHPIGSTKLQQKTVTDDTCTCCDIFLGKEDVFELFSRSIVLDHSLSLGRIIEGKRNRLL